MKIDGYPVVDPRRPAVVNVTAGDVKKAVPKNWASCAVAIACQRQPGVAEAVVHLTRTYIRKGKKWERYFTPKKVREALLTFDKSGKFNPGEYTLTPLPRTHREGAFRELYYKKPAKRRPGRNANRRSVGVRNHQGWNRRVEK
jgi:hypothetical protein